MGTLGGKRLTTQCAAKTCHRPIRMVPSRRTPKTCPILQPPEQAHAVASCCLLVGFVKRHRDQLFEHWSPGREPPVLPGTCPSTHCKPSQPRRWEQVRCSRTLRPTSSGYPRYSEQFPPTCALHWQTSWKNPAAAAALSSLLRRSPTSKRGHRSGKARWRSILARPHRLRSAPDLRSRSPEARPKSVGMPRPTSDEDCRLTGELCRRGECSKNWWTGRSCPALDSSSLLAQGGPLHAPPHLVGERGGLVDGGPATTVAMPGKALRHPAQRWSKEVLVHQALRHPFSPKITLALPTISGFDLALGLVQGLPKGRKPEIMSRKVLRGCAACPARPRWSQPPASLCGGDSYYQECIRTLRLLSRVHKFLCTLATMCIAIQALWDEDLQARVKEN